MRLIACIDTPERRGMSFNKRRVSQDLRVLERIVSLTNGHWLRMAPYSYLLFERMVFPAMECGPRYLQVSDGYLNCGQFGDYCFVEREDITLSLLDQVEQVVLYVWNRTYPADRKFPIDIFRDPSWKMVSSEEFVGTSHEKVTEVIFERA